MSNMDLLDLFGGAANPGKKAQNDANEKEGAPIEIMSQFLVQVSEGNMKEALVFCNQILEIEPKNQLMLDYKRTLTIYIDRGLDEEDEWETDDDNDDDDGDEENDDDDDEEEEDENDDGNDEGGGASEINSKGSENKQDEGDYDNNKKTTALRAKKTSQGDTGSHKITGGEVKIPNSNANSAKSTSTSSSNSSSNKSKK